MLEIILSALKFKILPSINQIRLWKLQMVNIWDMDFKNIKLGVILYLFEFISEKPQIDG